MINVKKLLLSIIIPLIAGILGYLLGGTTDFYNSIPKPSFAPPSIIFPIVWTILYILMGISYYLVVTSRKNKYTKKAVVIYYIQLALNALWSLIFFRFNLFFLAFLWIILLIILVSYMIYLFYKVNPKASYLQIPYLLWLIFANILSFSIFKLS